MTTTTAMKHRTVQRKRLRAQEMAAFGDALATAMTARGMSQTELAEQVGATQSMVSVWRNGEYECPHDVVFEMERILDLKPGALSIKFGYLPPEAVRRRTSTVYDSVLGDNLLSTANKHTLLKLYDHFIETEPKTRRRPRKTTANGTSRVKA